MYNAIETEQAFIRRYFEFKATRDAWFKLYKSMRVYEQWTGHHDAYSNMLMHSIRSLVNNTPTTHVEHHAQRNPTMRNLKDLHAYVATLVEYLTRTHITRMSKDLRYELAYLLLKEMQVFTWYWDMADLHMSAQGYRRMPADPTMWGSLHPPKVQHASRIRI